MQPTSPERVYLLETFSDILLPNDILLPALIDQQIEL
jgi:hypothetical protein